MTMNIIMQMEKIYKNNNYGNYQNEIRTGKLVD